MYLKFTEIWDFIIHIWYKSVREYEFELHKMTASLVLH